MDLVGAGLHPADWLGHVVALLLVLRPVVHRGHLDGRLGHLHGAALLPGEGDAVALLPGHPHGPALLPVHQVTRPHCLTHRLHLHPAHQVLVDPVDRLHNFVNIPVAGLALVVKAHILCLRGALPHRDILDKHFEHNQHPPPAGTYNVLGLRHCPARLDGVALAMLLGVLPTPRLVGVPVQSVLSESILWD